MDTHSPLRIGIYARYSSDLQNPSSVDDQVALCQQLIREQFSPTANILVFKDAALSGATMERPGMRRLMAAARDGRLSVVVAEGLDRLSRNLKDIAAIHETLGYHGVAIWTSHEGKISELHVGLKGTMNALYLKDMREKVRRGQSARIAAGFASSSCPYGYRVVRGVVDEKGRNVNGIRKIDDDQAAVVRRIFTEYATGRLIPDIIEGLNRDEIPSPAGRVWKRTALAGSPKKAEGILLNEAYIGNLVYNRTRIVRDPLTGKKRYIANPEDKWTRTHVPDLRIIDDPTWQKVQALHRRRRTEAALKIGVRKPSQPRILNSHNQHALTGWVHCGCCGGLKSLANESRYLCSNNRYAKTCTNSRGTKERKLMLATFEALKGRIKNGPDFREMLASSFAREIEASKALEAEAEGILRKINLLMEAVEQGLDREHVMDRVLTLQDELYQIRDRIRTEAPPKLPNEQTIRTRLLKAVLEIEFSEEILRQRIMFSHLLSAITLAPIPTKARGESLRVELREEGWAEFWRLISPV